MSFFLRPALHPFAATAVAICLALTPPAFAQHDALPDSPNPLLGAANQRVTLPGDDPALVTHPQSYLGVDIRDVDSSRAAQLRLKEARGAEVITVDHDAPAAKAGLQLHDVILAMNNQPVEGEAQLRRMLRETPPGRVVAFLISRNGQQQTINVQLADRSTIEADAWSQHIPVPEPDDTADASPSKGPRFGSSFLSVLGANPLYTGLTLDALGPQLADYFGVHDGSGLLIKRVDDNSPGATAGLRAGDVITKLNGQALATTSQWFHAMHSNRGKQVQLTVVRERHEQTLTMTTGHAKK